MVISEPARRSLRWDAASAAAGTVLMAAGLLLVALEVAGFAASLALAPRQLRRA